MVATIRTCVEAFQATDDDGFTWDANRIVAEITVDGEVVWSDSVVTNDTVESVCGVRETQYWKAAEHAARHYGYEIDEEDHEAAGFIIIYA